MCSGLPRSISFCAVGVRFPCIFFACSWGDACSGKTTAAEGGDAEDLEEVGRFVEIYRDFLRKNPKIDPTRRFIGDNHEFLQIFRNVLHFFALSAKICLRPFGQFPQKRRRTDKHSRVTAIFVLTVLCSASRLKRGRLVFISLFQRSIYAE